MKLERYKLKVGLEFLSCEFTSVRPKGMIKKQIQFLPVNDGQFYNLAFGDVDPVTGEIDDLAVSNNDDRNKILATIADAIYSFLNVYPEAWIYASGVRMPERGFIKSLLPSILMKSAKTFLFMDRLMIIGIFLRKIKSTSPLSPNLNLLIFEI